MRTIVWFRGKDVRLSDHAPLRAALAGGEVIPLFVLDPFFFAPERARECPHRVQFLLESVRALPGMDGMELTKRIRDRISLGRPATDKIKIARWRLIQSLGAPAAT